MACAQMWKNYQCIISYNCNKIVTAHEDAVIGSNQTEEIITNVF